MQTGPAVHRELQLGQLREFHESLVAALGEAGLGGARLAALFEQAVHAECMQCGMSVAGDEIAAALAAEDAHGAVNPKHARLLQHYCARNGCPSYFYRFEFQPVDGLDWEGVLTRAEDFRLRRAADTRTDAVVRHLDRRWARQKRLGAVLGILLVVGTVWAVRHWWLTGTLPGVSPSQKYQIDPRSLPPPPGAPAR